MNQTVKLLREAINRLHIVQRKDGRGVIPAQAGIHENTGFRIKSGMTEALSLKIFMQPAL